MFSGIVETLGTITNLTSADGCKHFRIQPYARFDDTKVGDSIAVNGVCLTVTAFDSEVFEVTAVPETLRITNLDSIEVCDKVNLERAMSASSRIGGHYVQGHVDGTGKITAIEIDDNSSAWLVKINCPEKITQYMVPKGYIGIDGMSITVIDVGTDWFTVTLIPHTQEVTIAQNYRIGDIVNLEGDMMGKHLIKMIKAQQAAPNNNEV